MASGQWARTLYSGLIYGATPAIAWRLHQRGKENPGYRERRGERFGQYPGAPLQRSLWVHTVSVGEFLAARPLIDWLLKTYPAWPVVVSTMTPTGAERVLASYGDRVRHLYLPYDMPHAVKRFLDHINPALLVIMETELWPNVIHQCHQRQVPVMLANARLSERSAQGYQRIRWLTAPMLQEITLVAAQDAADGERFVALGLPRDALRVTGTVKFDLMVDDALLRDARALRERWGAQRPVWIAASTHAGEDEQVLEAFRYLRSKIPGLLLVLVPRHPERFDAVASLVQLEGLKLVRHGSGATPGADTDVVLGDTMGELLKLLAASDVAFVGGSLEPLGGHNMLEPLAVGVPAICGPHVFNFAAVAALLSREGVLTTVSTPMGLADAVHALFEDAPRREALAARGQSVVDAHRGALQRICQLAGELLEQRGILPG